MIRFSEKIFEKLRIFQTITLTIANQNELNIQKYVLN